MKSRSVKAHKGCSINVCVFFDRLTQWKVMSLASHLAASPSSALERSR